MCALVKYIFDARRDKGSSKAKLLFDLLFPVLIEKGGIELASDEYFLLGGDLRDWSEIVQRLVHYGFDNT